MVMKIPKTMSLSLSTALLYCQSQILWFQLKEQIFKKPTDAVYFNLKTAQEFLEQLDAAVFCAPPDKLK